MDPNASSHRTFDPPRIPDWFSLLQPAEKAVGFLLGGFILLSLLALHFGRAGAMQSLWASILYAIIWMVWLPIVTRFRNAGWTGALRNIGPWVAVMLSYHLVGVLIPALRSAGLDPGMRRWDLRLGPGRADWGSLLVGHAFWADFFSAAYLILFAWLAAVAVYNEVFDTRRQRRFMSGIVLIYAGGFLGYVLCPAVGPRYAFPQEWTCLSGGALFLMCNRAVSHMGAKWDVFPSLHAALSTYLLVWQARFHPRTVLWGLPLVVCIWLSTLFLGFHYSVDLLAGGLLGWGSFWAAPKLNRWLRKFPRKGKASLDPQNPFGGGGDKNLPDPKRSY